MRSLGSFLVAGSVMLAAACASIAHLEDPDRDDSVANDTTPQSADSGSPAPSGSPSTDTPPSSSSSGDLPSADAATDAPPLPACLPPKKPNDSDCTTAADCCSAACSEKALCRASCRAKENDVCDPTHLLGEECCIGFFCSGALPPRCMKCIDAGKKPPNDNVNACCSRAVAGDGKCL